MHLGLDGRILAHPYSGIGCYLLNLIQRVKKLGVKKVSLYSDRSLFPEYHRELAGVEVVVFGERNRRHWGRWLLASRLKRDGVDLYHCVWDKGIPWKAPCPTVLTIHDVFPLIFPDQFKGRKRRFKYRFNFFVDTARTDKIITISECTRTDVAQRFPFLEKKITVIYDGVEPAEYERISHEEVNAWRAHYGLQKPYLISVLGRLTEKRKNIPNLMAAFRELQAHCPEVLLVIVGQGRAEGTRTGGSVRILENIPRPALLSLVKGSELMIHPTLYEGFGLPVLEAMCCGTPVIAGEKGAVPELFGESVLLVNPEDQRSMAASMKRLLEDPALRTRYKVLGKKKAEQFSWDKTAQETAQVYRQMLERDR